MLLPLLLLLLMVRKLVVVVACDAAAHAILCVLRNFVTSFPRFVEVGGGVASKMRGCLKSQVFV